MFAWPCRRLALERCGLRPATARESGDDDAAMFARRWTDLHLAGNEAIFYNFVLPFMPNQIVLAREPQ